MEGSIKTILVVDDQDDEREIQQALLNHLGYRVLTAGDGETGLHIAVNTRPDLILLDVAMPRMDGFTVCRALRSDPRTERVPVVFFTASVVHDLDVRAHEAGADGVLCKPLDPRQVASKVRDLIGAASA